MALRLILFLLAVSCSAQTGLRNPAFLSQLHPSGFNPQQIAGMAYFWDYRAIAQGQVINWPDNIQSFNFSNRVASTIHCPTNTASGVSFIPGSSFSWLTNSAALSLSSTQYSIWFSFTPRSGSANTYRNLMGDATTIWAFKNVPPSEMTYFFASADHIASGIMVTNTYLDFVWANGNVYTNGTSFGTTTIRTTTQTFQYMGDPFNSQNAAADIKFIGIWTNTTITQTDATNLHTFGLSN